MVEERNNISNDTLASVNNHTYILKPKSRQFLIAESHFRDNKMEQERLPAMNVSIILWQEECQDSSKHYERYKQAYWRVNNMPVQGMWYRGNE